MVTDCCNRCKYDGIIKSVGDFFNTSWISSHYIASIITLKCTKYKVIILQIGTLVCHKYTYNIYYVINLSVLHYLIYYLYIYLSIVV